MSVSAGFLAVGQYFQGNSQRPEVATAGITRYTVFKHPYLFGYSGVIMDESMDTEKSLLEGAHRFEEKALAEIYDRFSPGVYRYAMRLLGDAMLAEDCVAETFSRFLMALSRGKGPQQYLQAYLYRIAHNWITDTYRRQPLPALPLEPGMHASTDDDPSQSVALEMERQEIRAALAHLTPDQRQVIVLKYLEGWRNDDVAVALEKPVGAVKALQHRAINALRRLLVKEQEEII